jgi:hypothetical protein
LVSFKAQAHPHEMKMIRHQAVGWTKQVLSGGRVKHQFAKILVKCIIHPARGTVLNSHGPMHDRVSLVVPAFEAREMFLVRVIHDLRLMSPQRCLSRFADYQTTD